MGRTRRKFAQISTHLNEKLPFGLNLTDYIDALINEKCVSLQETRILSWTFIKHVLSTYFIVAIPSSKVLIERARGTFKNILRKKTTNDIFLNRLKINQSLNVQISESEEVKEIDSLIDTMSPMKINQENETQSVHQSECARRLSEEVPEIDPLIDTMSPMNINQENETQRVHQSECVRRLMVDAATSPFKIFENDGKLSEQLLNIQKANVRRRLMVDSSTSPIKRSENDGKLSGQLLNIQESIQYVVKLLGTQNSQENTKTHDLIFETTQNETKLIFTNKENSTEKDNEPVIESQQKVIEISPDTTLRMWKQTETNKFYCFECKNYDMERFWVNKNLEFVMCIKTQEIITDIYTARNVIAKPLYEKGFTCEFISEKSIINANALTFSSNGYCIHKDDGCSIKYRIHTTKGGTEGRHLMLFLNSSVPVDHSKMPVRFPQYRGKLRDDLKEGFTTPELMHRKLTDKIDINAALKGSMQGLTTKNVLRTVSSEKRKSNSKIPCELVKMGVFIQSGATEKYGTLIIQEDSVQLIMIDDELYKSLKQIPKKSKTMFTDASGQMVKQLQCCRDTNLHGRKKDFLVYANVINGENETVTTALMVSNKHNASTLGMFHSFHLTQMKLKIGKCIYKRIVTDWSIANFIALIETYNNMNVLEYLNKLYEAICNEVVLQDTNNFIYLVICYSHFMKIISTFAQRQICKSPDAFKENGYQKKQKSLLMSLFAHIQGCKTFKLVESLFTVICKIFCSKFLNKELQTLLINIKGWNLTEINDAVTSEDLITLNQYIDEQIQHEIKEKTTPTMRQQIKFYQRFKLIYDQTISKINNDDTSNCTVLNPYYVPGLVLRSIELYFSHFPLWSRLGHDLLQDDEDDKTFTNGLIESRFDYLKNHTEGPLRKRPTEFMMSMHDLAKYDRKKLAHPKLFPKTNRSKKQNKQRTKNKTPKRKHESESETESDMDASKHEEKWSKAGKTPKGFKYGKMTMSSSISNEVVNVKTEDSNKTPEKTPEKFEYDKLSLNSPTSNHVVNVKTENNQNDTPSPVSSTFMTPEHLSSSDDNEEKENEQVLEKAKEIKLTYYENSQLISTPNYYSETNSQIVKVSEYLAYEWLGYSDLLSLTKIDQQLTDVAMYCAVNLFIKANNLSDKYLAYITSPLTLMFTGKLNVKARNNLKACKQWIDLFTNPNVIHVCPFLVSLSSNNNHWVLAIIDFETKQLHFFDSLKKYDGKCFYNNFIKYIESKKGKDKSLQHFNGKWTLNNHNVTMQIGVTCGKHVLGFCRKYMMNTDTLHNKSFINVNPAEEALIFKQIIFQHTESRIELCSRCNTGLFSNSLCHRCIMCGYGLHIHCSNMHDFVIHSTMEYVCHLCVSYIKKHILYIKEK